MASIYQKPNSPYWQYDFTIEGHPRQRGSTKRKVKRDAQRVADEIERKFRERVDLGVRDELTLSEAVDLYLSRSTQQPAFVDIRSQLNKVRGKIKGHKGLDPSMPFHELSIRHLDRLKHWRITEGSKPNTINNEIRRVKTMVNNLAEMDEYRVPVLDRKLPVIRVKPKAKPLTDTEVEAVVAHLEARKARKQDVPHVQAMQDFIMLLLSLGCRHSELAGLRWSDVSADFTTVNIYRKKTGTADEVYVLKEGQEVLRRRRETQIGAFVFMNVNGRPFSRKTTRAIIDAMDAVGVNDDHKVAIYGRRTLHSLRDTYATRLVSRGISIDRVAAVLGHANLNQTRKYAKLTAKQASMEAARLMSGE